MRAAAALAALALLPGCWSDRAASRALQRMKEQPRAEAYGESRLFADGMAMRTPPPGTVPREAAGAGGPGAAGGPPPVTPALLARGRSRFAVYCAVCHGAGGWGGSVVAANLDERRPPSLHGPAVAALSPAALYGIVSNGVGRMPGYAAELPPGDRWAVVAYVGVLRRAAPAGAAEREDSVRGARLRALDSVRARDSARARDSLGARGPRRGPP